MRRPFAVLAGIAAIVAAPALAASPDHPVVLELFQSEGCSSCPPAEAIANDLASRPGLLVLDFSVTYWDYLGWKDRFARKEFTQRQYDYAATAGDGEVYTPQMVINGRGRIVGTERDDVEAALQAYDRVAPGPAITVSGGRLTVGADVGAAPATIWLVHYDPREIDVPIGAGENSGRTLPHRDLVRALIRLGDWHGTAIDFKLAPLPAGLAGAVIVQSAGTGPIIAARRL